jgi:hypothetical protein
MFEFTAYGIDALLVDQRKESGSVEHPDENT